MEIAGELTRTVVSQLPGEVLFYRLSEVVAAGLNSLGHLLKELEVNDKGLLLRMDLLLLHRHLAKRLLYFHDMLRFLRNVHAV